MGKRQQAQIEALQRDNARLIRERDHVYAQRRELRQQLADALNRDMSLVDVARREWGQMVDRVVDWSGFGR